jgi:hypothetical protein
VLGIASRHAGQYQRLDLALVLTVVGVATALIVIGSLLVVYRWERSQRTVPLAAAFAMIAVAWFFFFAATQKVLAIVSDRFSRDAVLMPLGILLTVAATAWLLRQPNHRLFAVSAFMTRFGALLTAITALPILFSETQASQIEKRSRLVRELSLPLRATEGPSAETNTPLRDIYLIVLDGHANSRVLRDVFDFDNSAFEDRLRALGLFVPRDMRSNYVQTYLSLASLLNASHLLKLSEDAGITSRDHSIPTYLVKNNRVARFLKDHGYKYVLFPSAWWAPTANSPLADKQFDARRGFGFVSEVYRTELRLAVLRSSLLRFAVSRDGGSSSITQHFLRSFQGLRDLPADPAPTFTFAHILLPHVPYVVDDRCRALQEPIAAWMEANTPEQRTAYINQVRCVDTLVLDLVTMLLRQSATSPIILIVGDHGPRFTDDIGFYAHPERVSTAFIRERFGAFGAFHLPAGGDTVFREPVTLVNVLGHVLRYYFNAELAPSSNEMYVSGVDLYRFYPVAAERFAP